MIEFHQTPIDINNATVWEIHFNNRKIGTLRKEEYKKIKGVLHGGNCYLSVLYRDYTLPFKVTKKQVKAIVQGAINNLEADAIMNRVDNSGWTESRWITLEKERITQNK